MKKYQIHAQIERTNKERRDQEDADAEARRQKALREAEERRRQEQADEYKRQHADEVAEQERKRREELEKRKFFCRSHTTFFDQ